MKHAGAFDVFVRQLQERLERGAVSYGEESFDRPEDELLGEISEELLDVAGWAWILWTRLEALRARVRRLPEP